MHSWNHGGKAKHKKGRPMRAEDVTPHVCNHEDPWRCTRPGHLMRAEDHVRPLRSDRHEKWQPVEPGHVIPAGQPYRWEWPDKGGTAATERVCGDPDYEVPANVGSAWFVDSSWRPPLELPTEPTWGIALYYDDWHTALWCVEGDRLGDCRAEGTTYSPIATSEVQNFIPLTLEQVRRIEGAR